MEVRHDGAVRETVCPTEDWAPVHFEEAARRRMFNCGQAIDAAIRRFTARLRASW